MRSRAVNRPLACWFSTALAPPPSQIFSPSLRTCDIRSARKRMLASKRAEVGSIFVRSRFAGDEGLGGAALRSAMGSGSNFYGITLARKRATQGRAEERESAVRGFTASGVVAAYPGTGHPGGRWSRWDQP